MLCASVGPDLTYFVQRRFQQVKKRRAADVRAVISGFGVRARARRCVQGGSPWAPIPAACGTTFNPRVIRQLWALYMSLLSVFRCKPHLPKLQTHGKLWSDFIAISSLFLVKGYEPFVMAFSWARWLVRFAQRGPCRWNPDAFVVHPSAKETWLSISLLAGVAHNRVWHQDYVICEILASGLDW